MLNFIARAVLLVSMLSSLVEATLDKETLVDLIHKDVERDLAPEKILEYLQEYNKIDPADEEIAELIELSRNQGEKCFNLEFFRDFYKHKRDDRFPKSRRMISGAIKSYKKDQWRKFVFTCKGVWGKTLEEDVESLTDEDRQQMLVLKHSIFDNILCDEFMPSGARARGIKPSKPAYQNKFYDTSSKKISEAMVKYFEQSCSNHELKELSSSSDKYRQKYGELVLDLCSRVRKQLERSSRFYELFVYTDENFVDDDKFVTDWLESLEVCRVVSAVKRRDDIPKYLRKELKVKHPGVGLVEKLRGCYGKECDQ